MAKPATREQLIDYSLRKLGAPVLEINVDDDQIDDLVDDAIQYYNERHMDGYIRTFLKFQFDQATIDSMKTDTSETVGGKTFKQQNNYITVPDHIISVIKIFDFTSKNTTNLFDVRYQWRLNDLWDLTQTEILTYEMVNRRLEDIYFLLEGQKQIRYNLRGNRLYMDLDFKSDVLDGDYIIFDCYRAIDPSDYAGVYNDPWLKRYTTALIKRQWGQNLIKFQGAQLPGGITLNGRELYEDGNNEVQKLEDSMIDMYEIPPLDMIG
jgi:hypothetical protein|tara:strand:+ start:5694 stop:6488 length:795 start_codon:yes stop_codon:yes gene_type:complete